MFVDTARITVKAGDGGNGAVAFHREKYVASGGPDGGDGGRGGNIIFRVDTSLSSLSDFRYRRKFKAKNGEPGKGGNKSGRKGEDLYISVPKGTIIKEATTGTVLADLSDDTEFLAAHGGKGGWGNRHFATATRQTPRFAKDGMPGEEWDLQLELKLLADVGLLGYPNVGKSSLISVCSEAKPIIGDYHFTTIIPVLGVVTMGEGNSFVMADIPGLIDGAADGVGLGHEFLRHVERCRMLIHIVDVAGSEGRDPIQDFDSLNLELKKYNPEMAKLPQIVAGNKIDMASDEQIETFKNYVESKGYSYYSICAPIKEGTKELMNATWNMLSTLPPVKHYESHEIPMEVVLSKKKDTGFHIRVEDGVYIIEAEWLAGILQKIDYDDYSSMQYLQHVLKTSGIDDALREKGIQDGDTVSIYDMEFEYLA